MYNFGLLDADLLDNGTRHPNLTLMKIAGYCKDHDLSYRLIHEDDVDVTQYEHIYVSKVFTKTKLPEYIVTDQRFMVGGTGFYATDPDEEDFKYCREQDMMALAMHSDLHGYDEAKQMPAYDLYDQYIDNQIKGGKNPKLYNDYKNFSIGFLTRGCIRHCEFCVNRYSNGVRRYSSLADFLDPSRKYIYLWDDNFMAAPRLLFMECIKDLERSGKPFQFKQGLDLRLMNEEKASILNDSRYHNDFIFAFDNWKDRSIITEKLKLWRSRCTRSTKLYLFCGFHITSDDEFLNDILCLFKRIEVLMQYGCLGYVMRHADYLNSPMPNLYVQIARWCNQPSIYKKKSFKEFIELCQTYQESTSGSTKPCKAMRTYKEFCERYPDQKQIIDVYFNMKYEDVTNY